MAGLSVPGAGPLTDSCASSHICNLFPLVRGHRSSSLHLRIARAASLDSIKGLEALRQGSSQPYPCQRLRVKRSRQHSRELLCRSASQPVPSARQRTVVSPQRGLRRSSSQSRLESPCRSTLAEPPVREEEGQVIDPEIVQAQDVTEEWSLFNRRRHVVKTVTDLTSGVLQAMEEIGALGQPGFSVSSIACCSCLQHASTSWWLWPFYLRLHVRPVALLGMLHGLSIQACDQKACAQIL